MKKLGILVTLLAAGVVVASGLFAQEIKVEGYVDSGLGVVISTEDNAPDPFIVSHGVDSWNNAFRIYLDTNYTNEAGNVGVTLRFRASAGYNRLSVPIGYGWFKAFDDILHVKAGIVDDATWHTGGAYFPPDNGEGLGTLIKVTPTSGLDLGVGAYLKEVPGEDTDNAQFSNPGGFQRDLDDAKYTFNLGYTMPDSFKITATYRPKAYLDSNLTSRAQASVSVLAVPGLKAIVELVLDNLQDFGALKNNDKDAWGVSVTNPVGSSGKISIGETFEYKLMDNNLTLGLWSVQWLSQAEGTDFSFIVNPWVSYALGSIIPRLDFNYGSGVQVDFNNGGLGNTKWRRGALTAKYDTDYSIISIRPSVKFQIDPNTHVEIGDLVNIDGDASASGGWSGDDSRISNVFYVDFKWSF